MRYARQTRLPEIGEAGQARLANTRVAVPGQGLSAHVAARYLAAAGVGSLVVPDAEAANWARGINSRVELTVGDSVAAPVPAETYRFVHAGARALGEGSRAALSILRKLVLAIVLLASMGGTASAAPTPEATLVRMRWAAEGASVEELPLRFLHEDEALTVRLPSARAECESALLLGPRGLSFRVRPSGGVRGASTEELRAATSVSSSAGAALVTVCGQKLPALSVVSDSGRGALRILFATSPRAVSGLYRVLPERVGGAVTAAPDPGSPPLNESASVRAARAEKRLLADGGRLLPRGVVSARGDGTALVATVLEPGCHALAAFAEEAAGSKRTDLDGELREEHTERLLAKDNTDAAGVALELCVVEEVSAELRLSGAAKGAIIELVHARYPLPPHLPQLWGGEARARLAYAFRSRSVAGPPTPAVFHALVAGPSATVPVFLNPGSCYLATAVVVRGQARSVALRLSSGEQLAWDDRGTPGGSGVVALCNKRKGVARIEVDTKGASVWLGVSLYVTRATAWTAR